MKPGYKQTEVGVIPEVWEVVRLSDVADLQVGFAFKSDWFGESIGTRLLRGENVGYGKADWSEIKTLKAKSDLSFRAYLLNPGDIVIGMDRTFTKSGSKFTLLDDSDCPCLLVQRVGRFFPRRCENRFLWFLLSSESVQTRLRLEQKGMDIPHLSRAEILHPMVPSPPLPEQRAIAGALSDVDALLGAQEALVAKKRDLKAAAMQQLLTGEMRLPGFTGQWEETTFGSVTRHHAGNSALIKGKLPSSEATDRYPAFSASGQDVWCDHFEHEGEAIVVSAVGSRCGKAFKASGRWCAIANTHVVWPNPARIDGRFLAYFINDEAFWQKSGTGQPFVLFAKTFARSLRLPPLPEQIAIAALLSDMDAEIAALEAQRDKTRALKQGMMQELLTGRIRLI